MERRLFNQINQPMKQPQPIFTCRVHGIALLNPFSSGAGFCRICALWTQGAELPPPELDEAIKLKRLGYKKAKQKLYRERARAKKKANEKAIESYATPAPFQ